MRTLAVIALYALALASGLAAAFEPTLASGFTLVQTDPGDTLLNHYILEHSWLCLTQPDYAGTLWSPPFFAPTPLTLAYSENLLGTAPLYWLLRTVCPTLLAFQLWMMLVSALTFAAFAWVLRRFGTAHMLCALGGWLFAFGMPRVNQLSHQQLLPQLFAPLAALALWRFLHAPRTRTLAALLLCAWLQLLSCVYLGWLTAFGLGVFAVTVACADPGTLPRVAGYFRSRWRRAMPLLLLAAVVTAALALPYREANRGFTRPYAECSCLLPNLRAWFTPPPDTLGWRPLGRINPDVSSEHFLFLGFTYTALFGVTVWALFARRGAFAPARHRLAACAAATGVILVLLVTKWPRHHSAWWLVYHAIPGSDAIRAPCRICLIAYLFGLMAVLLSFDAVVRSAVAGPWLRRAVWGVVAVAAAGEQVRSPLPAFDPRPFFAEADRLSRQMDGAGVAYVRPDPKSYFWVSHLAAMWAGLKANVPVVNGYTGREPPDYPGWTLLLTDAEVAAWLGPERAAGLVVVPAARVAQAYPAPPLPPDSPLREFLPHRPAAAYAAGP
jgi:hypothetical protein